MAVVLLWTAVAVVGVVGDVVLLWLAQTALNVLHESWPRRIAYRRRRAAFWRLSAFVVYLALGALSLTRSIHLTTGALIFSSALIYSEFVFMANVIDEVILLLRIVRGVGSELSLNGGDHPPVT